MSTVRATIGAVGATGAYAIWGERPKGTCPYCGCPGYHSINCPATKPEDSEGEQA